MSEKKGTITIWQIVTDNIYRATRRKYLKTFKPEYVKKMLAKRKGQCPPPKQCNCCWNNPTIFQKCEHASLKGCLLDLQGKEKPRACREYPIDEKDKSLYMKRNNCAYHWSENR